ncbi:unnamed protein product [Cylindrotheca closterium]|uniref:Uncharacterized protein n=1 Tax=Cylindrotheca closterium TaxID=2856 RepID=A0AAD2JLT8_9STRA|nr:unnamed protein product [Cylindrotheca closterium]
MANEEDDSMLYKSMLNKTLGLPDFNQYSYLFEDENGDDTESLLNTPSTDAEMSGTAADMSDNIGNDLLSATGDSRPTESFSQALEISITEPKGINQMTQRNQQLQNYWENQQKESQLIEEKLSNIRDRVEQNETKWEKEKNRLLSPQSRIPKPGRSSASALELQLETEREKRMELEVRCSALNRQLQTIQKDVESKSSASLRLETLKQMQKRHAEEIEEVHEQGKRARVKHAKELAELEDALLQSRQHNKELEGKKDTLILEIEQLKGAQQLHKDEMSALQEKIQEQIDFRVNIEKEHDRLDEKFKRQSLDMTSLREVVSGKEEEKAAAQAKLAATVLEKQQLQDGFDVLKDQKQRAEQEVKNLELQLIDTEKKCKEENVKTEIAIEQCEDLKSFIHEHGPKAHRLELEIQQLQENHHIITDQLKAEVEVYRCQMADLKEKYEEERHEHRKLRTKLEQLHGSGDTNELEDFRKQEDTVSDRHASFQSETMGKFANVEHRLASGSSIDSSLQNHVTRIETEHAEEIQELLQGLGQGQPEATDWSSHFESRNESKGDFSTPFKVKSKSTDGNLSGVVLSPILRVEHSETASMGSDNVERKIDGLLEEIDQMDQEREEMLGELQQGAPNSENLRPSDGSRLNEVPTKVSQKMPNDVSESPFSEHSADSDPPSNDLLDGTILLLNNLKDLMDGQESENEKETSVLDQLEALSEMMHGETNLSDFLTGSRSINRSSVSAMRESVHSRASGRVPSSPLKSSTVHDEEFDAGSLKQKEEIWRMLVAELRHRILFLEHDRNEVVRLTGSLLERERDANRLRLQSAMSSARREAFEEFQSLLEVGGT